MSSNTAIGKVTGPGEENGEVRILTSDNKHTRIGEFLIYRTQYSGEEKTVFLKITKRQIIKNLPNYFMSDPLISAEEISKAIGIDNSLINIQYSITAKIIGYFDKKLSSFINPRINPNPDTIVYLAADDLLRETLSSKENHIQGSAHIGNLLLRPNIPIMIAVNEMISTHFAILAGTGSGKSYLARVIIEELMRPYNNAAVCIFDPHGEYTTFAGESNEPQSMTRLKEFKGEKTQAKVKILQPGLNLTFAISELDFGEICSLLSNLTEKMRAHLEKIHDTVYKQAKRAKKNWLYQDLIREIDKLLNEDSQENQDVNLSTLNGLRWRLEARFGQKRKKDPIFVDNGGTYLCDIFEPGQCTVIDLSQVEEEEQQILAHVLLSKTYEARVKHKNQIIENESRNALEYPVFVLMEEAHRFAPQGGDQISCRILRRILAEGRKFGVGVGLITQRPGKLDQNVLSQCMTQFLMRIINPVDQESVKQGVESAGRDLLDELPALSKGQVIATGVAMRTPLMLQVREALTRHGGHSAEPVEEWISHGQNPNKNIEKTAVFNNMPSDYQPNDWE